jgi:hypothetical protein
VYENIKPVAVSVVTAGTDFSAHYIAMLHEMSHADLVKAMKNPALKPSDARTLLEHMLPHQRRALLEEQALHEFSAAGGLMTGGYDAGSAAREEGPAMPVTPPVSPTPTVTPTRTPTPTISITPTRTPTPTISITPTRTPTPTVTPTKTPAPTPSVTSGSMFIPGTSSRVTLSPGIVVGGTTTTPFTVEGWFYSTVTPGTNSGPVLLSTDTSSATPSYAKALTINIGSTTQIIVDSNGAAQQAFNFAETMLVNTWYYVAVSRDSSGYLQAWLGKDGDANATVSTTARLDTSGNAAWQLTGLSNTIGAFVPAGRYTTGYISNLRVDSTGLYATTAATIPVPTAPFEELAGTVFLQNDATLTDKTGTQTLTGVGTAAGNALNPF